MLPIDVVFSESKGSCAFGVLSRDDRSVVLVNPGRQLEWCVDILRQGFTCEGILLSSGQLKHAARAAELQSRTQARVFCDIDQLYHCMNLRREADKMNLCGVKVPIAVPLNKHVDEIKLGIFSFKVIRFHPNPSRAVDIVYSIGHDFFIGDAFDVIPALRKNHRNGVVFSDQGKHS